jgi:hypothetical protein
MKKRLDSLTSSGGVIVDGEAADELVNIMDENKSGIKELPKSDFRRILWEQQVHSCTYIVCIVSYI